MCPLSISIIKCQLTLHVLQLGQQLIELIDAAAECDALLINQLLQPTHRGGHTCKHSTDDERRTEQHIAFVA